LHRFSVNQFWGFSNIGLVPITGIQCEIVLEIAEGWSQHVIRQVIHQRLNVLL